MKKYLGIDWGEKRIGLALADSENKISTPFKTVSSPAFLIELIKKEKIACVVIGEPKKMSGDKANNARFIKFVEFIKNKLADLNLEIILIDERLSSIQADSIMNKKMNDNRDSLAAMIILQSYLDKK